MKEITEFIEAQGRLNKVTAECLRELQKATDTQQKQTLRLVEIIEQITKSFNSNHEQQK